MALPSYHGGLPVFLLEGMAARAIPEVVTEENGLLVKPGDIPALTAAFLRCSQDVDMLRGMSVKNLEKAEASFGVHQIHQQLAKLYQGVSLKSGPPDFRDTP